MYTLNAVTHLREFYFQPDMSVFQQWLVIPLWQEQCKFVHKDSHCFMSFLFTKNKIWMALTQQQFQRDCTIPFKGNYK